MTVDHGRHVEVGQDVTVHNQKSLDDARIDRREPNRTRRIQGFGFDRVADRDTSARAVWIGIDKGFGSEAQ